MKYLVTSENTILTDLSVLELDDLSIGIPKSFTLWSPEKCKISSSKKVIITSADENSNISTSDTIEIEAKGSVSILLESYEEKQEVILMVARYEDGTQISWRISQNYKDFSDKLVVLLNNYGVQVTDEWVRCFFDSDYHEQNPDMLIKNQKSSEFLLELMTLLGLRGTYKTLFSAVSYFGYADIVWFEEHWLSNVDGITRRYTEITNDFIEKRLTQEGYTKIGDMTMFYGLTMLDPEEPYDEGGLPNFVSRNINFDDLYFKLILLRKILNKSFIPWDAYIVDIVGEFKAVAGLQKKWWIANDAFINQDETHRFEFLDINFEGDITDKDGEKHLLIREHKMLVDEKLYSVNSTGDVSLTNPKIAHINKELIKIEKLDVDELVDLKDFDIITKFQRKDVGVIVPKFTLHTDGCPDWITGFTVQLSRIHGENRENVFTSRLMSWSDITTNSRYGITQPGRYEFVIWAHDCWGYRHKYYTIVTVEYDDVTIDFSLMRPRYVKETRESINRYQHFTQTQETTYDGVPVADATDKNWNVNEPDNVRVINRTYTTEVTNPELFLPIRRYGNSVIRNLQLTPISEFWAPYNLLALNILKTGVKFSLKIFPHHEYETIEFKNELQFLHKLIEASKNPNSPFSFFDYDVQPVNISANERLWENENDLSMNMLLIYSKLKSFSINNLIFRIEFGDDIVTNDPNEQGYLNLYEQVLTFFGRKLTLFTKRANSNIPITDMTTKFETYKSQIYPSFGCDALIRFNTIYNVSTSAVNRFVLHGRFLTLYDHPLAFFQNPEYMDDDTCSGILTWMYKELYLGDSQLVLYPTKFGNEVLIDYHLKIRVGDVWFTSVREYGKPIYEEKDGEFTSSFETPPLDFDKLKSLLDITDKNFTNELGIPEEVLENLDIYYYDSSFVVRSRNHKDIEICHMNLGHKIGSDRSGSISKMYICPSGEPVQYGGIVIATPNEDIHIGNRDVRWTIKDHFSTKTIFECYGYVLKYLCLQYGVFDVEMSIIDKTSGENLGCKKVGAFLVE